MRIKNNIKIFKKKLAGKNIIFNFAPLFTADSVAQLVEHRPFKPRVLGSSPSGITKKPLNFKWFFLFTTFSQILPKSLVEYKTIKSTARILLFDFK